MSAVTWVMCSLAAAAIGCVIYAIIEVGQILDRASNQWSDDEGEGE